MSNFIDKIKQNFTAVEPLPSGMHHYISPPDNPLNYRLHLRLDPDGNGILIVNAATVLHLNQTAAEYAYHIVKGTPPEQTAKEISKRYKVGKRDALEDYKNLQERIETLITTPDLDPVTFLNFERHNPYEEKLSAPYRLDCALTYRLPEGATTEAAPTKRVDRELSTEEWKTIIDKAWEAGIPHILFTGGEPTLRGDLVELIQHAEDNGQVSGLMTDGLKLGDTTYLNSLLQAGLDHTMIILQPNIEKTWDSLSSFAYWTETLDEDIFVAAHLTLTKENSSDFLGLIDKITEAGVSAISLSENDASLSEELRGAREYADDQNIDLVWDMPVPYSMLNPIALELEMGEEDQMLEGAGKGWLYVEPDGDVLPTQGINEVLGNMLRDDWNVIWEKASTR